MSSFLEIDGLSKRFGDLAVLDRVTLSVEEGEVLALLGPSGSGKTTFLRLLAGFETAGEGSITVAGREVGRLGPAERGFGMVFQHYALFPHLTVAGNVAFGLEAAGAKRDEIARRVERVLALVDLEGFEARRIGELSGGQQQRVALARALAPRPRLLLLDEPLSNLDPALRERTRRELLAAIRRVGITTVLVTHEQEEAFDLGDRVAVLWTGRLQQVGSPEELYLEPANRFVATFIGRSSILPGVVEGLEAGGGCRVRLAVGGAPWPAIAAEGLAAGAAADLVIRPESLRLVRDGTGGEAAAGPDDGKGLLGRVLGRRYGGPLSFYQVALDGAGDEAGPEVEVLARDRGGRPAASAGDRVRLLPAADGPAPRAFPAASAGGPVAVATSGAVPVKGGR